MRRSPWAAGSPPPGSCGDFFFSLFLRKVVTVAKSRSFRDRHGKVLLEGLRLVRDALEAGAVPCSLFFSAAGLLRELPQARLKGASLVKVKFEEIKSWSDLVTPQGVIGKIP